MQQAKVGGSVLDLARPLVGDHLSHTFPSFHVTAAKNLVSLSLADKFRVVMVCLQQPDYPCRKVVNENVVWNEAVKKTA